MTRPEAIERWKEMATAIFWAEERISKEWYPRLKGATNFSKEEQHKFADAYMQAIAEEIVGHMSDEQLAAIE